MSELKKYVGKGKQGKFDIINIGLRYEDLKPNERGYVNICVGKMKNPDDKGNTHTAWLNDFQPKRERDDGQMQVEDIPF